MIKAVLFDLDGVLIESEIFCLQIKKDVCERHGFSWTEEDYNRIAGKEFKLTVPVIFPDKSQEEIDEIIKEYYSIAYADPDYKAMATAGAGETLGKLKDKGYRIGLATMSHEDKIDKVLEVNGWKGLIEIHVGSDDCDKRKPDPSAYNILMQRLIVKPEECVIVEDSKVGIIAAKAAGVYCICRKETRYPADQSGADHYIEDLREIPEIIDSLNK